MDISILLLKIECLRKQLNEEAANSHLTADSVLCLSRELDKLINLYDSMRAAKAK